jgi:hypothetical protein
MITAFWSTIIIPRGGEAAGGGRRAAAAATGAPAAAATATQPPHTWHARHPQQWYQSLGGLLYQLLGHNVPGCWEHCRVCSCAANRLDVVRVLQCTRVCACMCARLAFVCFIACPAHHVLLVVCTLAQYTIGFHC